MLYRYSCGLDGNRAFTHFISNFRNKTCTYICINCPDRAASRLVEEIGRTSISGVIDRPFILDALIADECINAWAADINVLRKNLITYASYNLKLLERMTTTNNLVCSP